MTDKEKAEEYAKNKIKVFDKDSSYYFFHIKQAYLDGLAEGRKEKCLEQNNDGTIRPCEVMKENEQLEKENEILVWRILELQKTCGTLTDKIEKMKNCKNCFYGMSGGCDYYNAVPAKVQNCEHWKMINQ